MKKPSEPVKRMYFLNRLAAIMIAHSRMSNGAIARSIGLSTSTWSLAKNGKRKIERQYVERLCRLLSLQKSEDLTRTLEHRELSSLFAAWLDGSGRAHAHAQSIQM